MPITLSSFQIPLSPSIPYLLEDTYLKGGYRSVATLANLNAIHPVARKPGMLVYCLETDTIYKLSTDKLTFIEWATGNTSGGGGGTPPVIGTPTGIGTRYNTSLSAGELAPSAHVDTAFELEAISAMVLELSVDLPAVMIQIFAYDDMSDTNPYTFVSTESILRDDGMTLIDGTLLKGRRFALISTEEGTKTHRIRVTNMSETDTLSPTIKLKYLKLE